MVGKKDRTTIHPELREARDIRFKKWAKEVKNYSWGKEDVNRRPHVKNNLERLNEEYTNLERCLAYLWKKKINLRHLSSNTQRDILKTFKETSAKGRAYIPRRMLIGIQNELAEKKLAERLEKKYGIIYEELGSTAREQLLEAAKKKRLKETIKELSLVSIS